MSNRPKTPFWFNLAVLVILLMVAVILWPMVETNLPKVAAGQNRLTDVMPPAAVTVVYQVQRETAVPILQIVTATPAPAVVATIAPTQPPQPPKPTETAVLSPMPTSAPETAVDGFTTEFLTNCATGQAAGRRVSPRCPANAGELLGGGR